MPSATPTASATGTTTPSPTIGPSPTCQTADACALGGDADCDGDVDLVDVKVVLVDTGDLEPAPCPVSGNVKCDDPLNGYDALMIVKKKAGLAAQVPSGCKPIG